MVNETIKYEYVEENDLYVVEIVETGAERVIDGITVKEVFEIFEEEVNEFSDEQMNDIEIIREMIDVVSALLCIKPYIVQLSLLVNGVLPIDSKNNLKDLNNKNGDNMEWTTLNETEIDEMSLEEFEQCGTIAERSSEDVEFEFNDLKGVFFKIIELGFDLTKTNAFKEAKADWFKSEVDDEDIFLEVFFDKLVNEEIVFKQNKNIIIEASVEDASFDYDYGSISSTHYCSIVIGYNVIIEDID